MAGVINFYGKGKIPWVKCKLLQDAKERGGLDLPDFKLYFVSCCLVWMKALLRNRRPLELERHDLRFEWDICSIFVV